MIRQAATTCVRRAVVAKRVDATVPRLLRPFWSTSRLSSSIGVGLHQQPPWSVGTTSVRSFSLSADTLSDILEREHAEELMNETTTLPEDLKELRDKVQANWKIVDSAPAVTKLYKTVGAFKVQISCHCQDATVMEEEEFSLEEGEVVEEEDLPASFRFTVTATKAGKSLVMICVSEMSDRIQSIAVTDTDVETIHSIGIDKSGYQGPEFTELSEDVQSAFHRFLEEGIGVDNDVAAFIGMNSDYKEQCQYVKFLEDAKSILS
jgi:hypothetical protein